MSRRTLIALGMTSSYSMVTILLVALRLTGIIEWSWLWVFAPLWLPLAIMAFTFGVLALRERIE
jgi:hypothetical protein